MFIVNSCECQSYKVGSFIAVHYCYELNDGWLYNGASHTCSLSVTLSS